MSVLPFFEKQNSVVTRFPKLQQARKNWKKGNSDGAFPFYKNPDLLAQLGNRPVKITCEKLCDKIDHLCNIKSPERKVEGKKVLTSHSTPGTSYGGISQYSKAEAEHS